MSLPSKLIEPDETGSKPRIAFNSVVLPAPLLPTMLTHSPAATSKLMSLTTVTLP